MINVIDLKTLDIEEMNYYLNHWDGTTPNVDTLTKGTTPCLTAPTIKTHTAAPTVHETGAFSTL